MNAKTVAYCSAVVVHSLAWNVCACVTFYVVGPVSAYLWTSLGCKGLFAKDCLNFHCLVQGKGLVQTG